MRHRCGASKAELLRWSRSLCPALAEPHAPEQSLSPHELTIERRQHVQHSEAGEDERNGMA
jgi:hypothetical protein